MIDTLEEFFLSITIFVILPMVVLVAGGLAIRKHFLEKADEAASIARIQEAARAEFQEADEKIWPPGPSHAISRRGI
jgi:hypothetical protein